ncbi:hypothetical protein V8E54_013957 [Elaphomyces granulatus]
MLVQSLTFVALLVGQTLAQVNPGSLVRRQGQGFIPTTILGCPAGWPSCGTICYLPSRGDTCCPDGTYACPGGSFCLVAPYCCDNGLDPQSCAQQYGVTLPAGYSSGATQPPAGYSSGATQPPAEYSSGATQPPAATPSGTPTGGASALPTITPPPAAYQSTTTAVVPTTPTVPTSSKPLLTGGASSQNILGGAAALAGVVGLLGNIF